MKHLSISREQLPQFVKDNILKDDSTVCLVEVGSFEGTYAKIMLDSFPQAHMSLVDMWETHGNDFYYSIREGTVERAYEVALKRFEGIKNVAFLKEKSKDAVSRFDDESIDFIYIDADHSYEGCLQDLMLWYPKVKKGGIIAGHDWDCDPSMPEFHKFGVHAAVTQFFADKLQDMMLTSEQFHKSWALIK